MVDYERLFNSEKDSSNNYEEIDSKEQSNRIPNVLERKRRYENIKNVNRLFAVISRELDKR